MRYASLLILTAKKCDPVCHCWMRISTLKTGLVPLLHQFLLEPDNGLELPAPLRGHQSRTGRSADSHPVCGKCKTRLLNGQPLAASDARSSGLSTAMACRWYWTSGPAGAAPVNSLPPPSRPAQPFCHPHALSRLIRKPARKPRQGFRFVLSADDCEQWQGNHAPVRGLAQSTV